MGLWNNMKGRVGWGATHTGPSGAQHDWAKTKGGTCPFEIMGSRLMASTARVVPIKPNSGSDEFSFWEGPFQVRSSKQIALLANRPDLSPV